MAVRLTRDRLLAYGLLAVYVLIIWFPIYYIFITSIKPSSEVLSLPITFLPQSPTAQNYVDIFTNRPFDNYTINSMIVATTTTLICITLGTVTGYSFSRYDFLGNSRCCCRSWRSDDSTHRSARRCFQTCRPAAHRRTHREPATRGSRSSSRTRSSASRCRLDNENYFDGIPESLDEQARIDGCSRWEAFVKIILPMANRASRRLLPGGTCRVWMWVCGSVVSDPSG